MQRGPGALYYVGWSRRPASVLALRPLRRIVAAEVFNTAYYKNEKVDTTSSALATTDKTEKAKLYKDAQQTIWNDAVGHRSSPKNAVGHNKKLMACSDARCIVTSRADLN